ncbi:hypothetical protein CFH99_16675 [Nocardioides aromaticivorans]|uniref:Restriction endonuclease type IV Mrr domain-containing protein n=1 Tax=Nocardioides aromaticivorans TaxID=200618 RepID=A0ABX7PNI7_9ACTN|nr:restriction endonuclease [Nocardioides aromaticivorans]QSR27257.1 hypothetical protein CFH99_16675 [Nocardioides aromaticivorans]
MQSPEPPPRQIDGWQDAELNAANWMRHWGFSDARANPGGSDGGVDVFSSTAIGQVKYQGAPVGRPALQNLVGADMSAGRRLLFFTGSTYAAPAVDYASRMRIALFRYDPWGRMEAVNFHAHDLIRSAAGREDTASRVSVAVPALRSVPPAGHNPIKVHFKRHWALWCVGFLAILPFAYLGDPAVYSGPFWLDVLKFVGIYAGCWLGALLFLLVHALLRGYGGSRVAALRTWLQGIWFRLNQPG